MVTIKVKRVYEVMTPDDGFRIFVDKLWPRGIKKENLHYDLWAKEVTPSPDLRSWFHQNIEQHWSGFKEAYWKELETSPAMESLLHTIQEQQTVTLLYASKDLVHNHALLLQAYIEKALFKS